MTSLSTHVELFNGSPTLFINGVPDTGLMLYHSNLAVAEKEIAEFGKAGIPLFTTDIGSTSCLQKDGTIDSSDIDAKMRLVVAANPDAKVLARVALNPPRWWLDVHAEQMMIHRDPYLGEDVEGEYDSVSFASELWRRDMAVALREVIRHMEKTWGANILGYHLAGGECGEWSYIWRNYTQSDYSGPQQDAFRHWLRGHYAGDLARFSAAWGVGDFNDAVIPGDWRWVEGAPEMLSAQSDQPLRDYLIFQSEVVADAALHFSRVTKDELARLGAKKVVALFYGYHFTPPGNPSAFTDSGHHALRSVLESPDVDILCAPYSYNGREHGGCYYSQLVAGSVRVHGKLIYSEDDTVTHVVSRPIPYRYNSPDGWTSRHVILRNILGALRDGGTVWYMDWLGLNWYDDEELVASFSSTQAFARERLGWDTRSVAEVAIFASAGTIHRLRPLSPSYVPWVLEAVADLHRLGAPLDLYLLHDLPAALQTKTDQPYKVLIFLDIIEPDAEEQAAIKMAESCGATLLWTVPPDFEPAGEGIRLPLPIDMRTVHQHACGAGVHLYSQAGDYVVAEKHWLAVHARDDGEREIHLPPDVEARPLWDAHPIFSSSSPQKVLFQKGETKVWTLEPVTKESRHF